MRRALGVILALLLVTGVSYGSPAIVAERDRDFEFHGADPNCEMSARPLGDTDGTGTWAWSYAAIQAALEIRYMAPGDDVYRFIKSNSSKSAAEALSTNRDDVYTQLNRAANQGMRSGQPAADATYRALRGGYSEGAHGDRQVGRERRQAVCVTALL